jgi:hypothetical protein
MANSPVIGTTDYHVVWASMKGGKLWGVPGSNAS